MYIILFNSGILHRKTNSEIDGQIKRTYNKKYIIMTDFVYKDTIDEHYSKNCLILGYLKHREILRRKQIPS